MESESEEFCNDRCNGGEALVEIFAFEASISFEGSEKARESDCLSLAVIDWIRSIEVGIIGFTLSSKGLRSETSSKLESTDERSSSKLNSGALVFSASRKSRLSAMLDALFSSSESRGDE